MHIFMIGLSDRLASIAAVSRKPVTPTPVCLCLMCQNWAWSDVLLIGSNLIIEASEISIEVRLLNFQIARGFLEA